VIQSTITLCGSYKGGSGSDVDPIDEYAVQQLKELTEEDEVCPQLSASPLAFFSSHRDIEEERQRGALQD
jgi:hypothetical protein